MVAEEQATSGRAVGPVKCSTCEVRSACIGHDADSGALERLDGAVERRLLLAAGDYLYHSGDPFKSLYAVRTGCLMHTLRDARGRDQVMGFHMMGDVVGVAGIGPQVYMFDMLALEASDVCELPFDRLEDLAARDPALRQNIAKIFGRYRNRDAMTQSLRRSGSAGARLAGFLLDLSRRLGTRGLDPTCLRLPMSDAQLASYLGLEIAEVEAAFAQLGEHAVAKLSGRTVFISAVKALQTLAASGA